MLSLGRKQGETIMIGDDIMIKVINCCDNVRIGIVAPKELSIVRGELYEKEQSEEQAGHEA